MNQTQAFPAKGFTAFRNSKKDDYIEVDTTDPLLKPLLIDFSVQNLMSQLKNNSFECDAAYYEEALSWL